MKFIFLITLMFVTKLSWSSTIITCSPGEIRIWTQAYGYSCIKNYQSVPVDCVLCQANMQTMQPYHPYGNWFTGFPSAIYQPYAQPWWAIQGNMYYPNMYYPGAWSNQGFYPGINANYYHGQGGVFAAKPNVYI